MTGLDIKKATGIDGINAWLLKVTASAISPSLSDLFNHTLKTSEIPTKWKSARITPILKKSNVKSVENFRPISISFLLWQRFMNH